MILNKFRLLEYKKTVIILSTCEWITMIYLLIFLQIAHLVNGWMRHGVSTRLGSDFHVTNTGWKPVRSWYTPLSSDQLFYLKGISIQPNGFVANKEGLYFVSSNMILKNITVGTSVDMVVCQDAFHDLDQQKNLRATKRNNQFGDLTISVSGFIFMTSKTFASVYVRVSSSSVISKESSVSLHHFGRIGLTPGFTAALMTYKSFQKWTSTSSISFFNSKQGLSNSAKIDTELTGDLGLVYVAPSSGIYMITCNIIVKTSKPNLVKVFRLVNNEKQNTLTKIVESVDTLSINIILKFTKADTFRLLVEPPQTTVAENSTVSVLLLDYETNSHSDISMVINQQNNLRLNMSAHVDKNILVDLYNLPSTAILRPSQNKLQTLSLPNVQGLICNQGSYYVAQFLLNYQLDTRKSIVSALTLMVGSNKISATEYQTATANTTHGSISLTGTLKCDVTKLIELKFTISTTATVSFIQGSSFSLVEIRLTYPFSLFLRPSQAVVDFRLSSILHVDLHDVNKQNFYLQKYFHTKEFRVPFAGIYFISIHFLLKKTFAESSISMGVSINGQLDETNGLYACATNKNYSVMSLRIVSNLLLSESDVLTVYLKSRRSENNIWTLSDTSNFFVVFLGKTLNVLGLRRSWVSNQKVLLKGMNLISAQSATNNKLNYVIGDWSNSTTGQDKYFVPFSGVYIVSCNVILKTLSQQKQVNYKISIAGDSTTTIHPVFDATRSSESGEVSLVAAGVFRLSTSNHLTCKISLDEPALTIIKAMTFTVAFLSYESEGTGFNVFLDSANAFSLGSSWKPVTGFSTNQFPGFKTTDNYFDLNTGQYTPPEELFLIAFATLELDQGNAKNLYEGAIELLKTSQSANKLGLYAKRFDSGVLSFHGLIQMRGMDQIRLVIKDSNNTDQFYQLREGTGWSMYSVTGNIRYSPVLLTSIPQRHGAPYIQRELSVDTIQSKVFPNLPGTYAFAATIDGWSSRNGTLAEIIIHDVINSVLFVPTKATSIHTDVFYCDIKCLTNGITINSSSQIQSLALLKIGSVPSDGFVRRLPRHITLPAHGRTYLMQDFVQHFSGGHFGESMIIAPKETATYLISVKLNFNASGSFRINLIDNWSTIKLSESSSSMLSSYSGLHQLKMGHFYHINLQYKSSSTSLRLEKHSSIAILNYFNGNRPEIILISTVESDTVMNLTSNQTNVIKGWTLPLGKATGMDTASTFYSCSSGTYLITANVIIRVSTFSMVQLSLIYEEEMGLPGLTSEAYFAPQDVHTLNIFAPIYMKEQRYVKLVILLNETGTVEILNGSSFSVSSIELDVGTSCMNVSEAIANSRVFISAINEIVANGRNVTLSCWSTYPYRSDFYWYQNQQVVWSEFGVHESNLQIKNAQAGANGVYRCEIRQGSYGKMSNQSRLKVLGMLPEVYPTYANISLDESVNEKVVLKTFNVMAFISSEIDTYAQISASLTPEDAAKFSIEYWRNLHGVYTFRFYSIKALDYELQSAYNITITFLNVNTTRLKNERYTTKVNVLIFVNNVNEPPRFTNSPPSSFYVPEDAVIGTICYKVEATDDGEYFFSILNGTSSSYFEIDQYTGDVSLRASLDREAEDLYVVYVKVYDHEFSRYTEIKGYITDVNDNPPYFKKIKYEVSVAESLPTESSIIRLEASDDDLDRNAELVFEITSNNDSRTSFDITEKGVIVSKKKFGQLELHGVKLTVIVSDRGGLTSDEVCVVEINVMDVNDNQPTFELSEYVVSIDEETTGSFLQVKAIDNDTSVENRRINYYINDKGMKKIFHIDSVTGLISTSKILDYEEQTTYKFQVFATDGRVENTGLTNVVINILDINDNSPIFQTASNITVLENTPINSIIFRIQAVDLDSGSNGNVRYYMTSISDVFSVDFANGYLKLLKTLDYELAKSYTLKLLVTDNGLRNVRYSEQTFTVLVSDINDNYPEFTQATFTFDVKENQAVGTEVGCVVATDLDKDILKYTVNDAYHSLISGLFHVNPQTGCIQTLLRLDREVQDVFNFAIEVADAVEMPFSDYASVVIQVTDENDNAPIFPQKSYAIQLSESTHIGQTIMIVSASDADVDKNGAFEYHITSGNQQYNFLLVKESLILIKPLDLEKQSSYQLTIEARDGGVPSLSSTTSIFITVVDRNDNQPYFGSQLYEVEIEENIPIGTFVLKVSAIDEDMNSLVTFTIETTVTSQENYFDINSTTGAIKTTHSLDFEKEKSYWLTVTATDNGKPKLKSSAAVLVNILDMNDNAPVFEQTYVNVSVPLEAVVGMVLTTVKASDLDSGTNGEVEYYQVSPNNLFHVDADSGEVSLAKKLTKRTGQHFMLQVLARDKGQPSIHTKQVMVVQINVIYRINNDPVFTKSSYVISLLENALKGAVLKVIAWSPLNSSLTYSILPSSYNPLPFIIDMNSGNVILFNTLDYENEVKYVFYVRASVQLNPEEFSVTMVTIHILNINDNRPYFDKMAYEFKISEFAPIGLQVGQVWAKDADSGSFGDIVYSITAGEKENVFTIEKNTGIIRVTGKLDYELQSQYDLLVAAADKGIPPLESPFSTKVKINLENVNDHQPIFDKTEYTTTVSEKVAIGTTILTLRVHDTDNVTVSVQLQLKHHITDLPFFLTQAGELVVIATLDREKRAGYDFVVQATDTWFKSTANVRIIVADYNDNAPYFAQEVHLCNITESALPGTLLTVLSAIDEDIGMASQLSYSIKSYANLFAIVSTDNVGRLLLRDKLDFEKQSEYYVVIAAQDNGSPYQMSSNYATVKIQVKDENDNSPQFLQNTYNLTVDETESSIGKITAVDEDSGNNGKLIYRLLENLDSNHFNIDQHSGLLVKQGAYFGQRWFSLTVMVSDSGYPARTASVSVFVNVEDVNEFYPVFHQSLYNVEVSENISNGSFVARMTSTDKDNEHAIVQQISYQIISGDENKDFSIDDNGVLTTVSKLDREKNSQFRLIIQASDNGRPQKTSQTHALVLVTILDENDNSPQFNQTAYNITVLESTSIGSSVFQVSAVDLDTGSNSDIHYDLITSSYERNFIIDQSGNLILKKSLRYAEKSLHRLIVTASDKGSPHQRSNMCEILIHVRNVNDRPFFSPTEYEITIPENTPIGFSVIALTAFDLGDTIQTQHLKYSIISGNIGNTFKMNGNRVIVSKIIDFESIKIYILSVQVFDSDQPPSMAEKAATIKINIQNMNDNQPYFDRSYYTAIVDEEVSIGTVVTRVKAFDNDQNAVLSYMLLYNEVSGYFQIDQNGVIATTKRLDYEQLKHTQLSFVVRVIDARLPYIYTDANVIVTVNDVNDHHPEFHKEVYQAIISETSSVGTIIVHLTASDLDSSLNGKLKYNTDNDRANMYFLILEDLIVLKKSLFDIEPKYFEFRVTAADEGYPSLQSRKTANVSIVVKQSNHVIFKFAKDYYNVTISENWTSNDVIITPQLISSRRSNNIIFSLDEFYSDYLTINVTTGEVSLKKNTKLDYSKIDKLVALVKAKDMTLNTATTSIHVTIQDQNNHKPEFDLLKYEATILRRTQIGSSILKVKASDNDVIEGGSVRYELLTPQTPFIINSKGDVILSESLSGYSNHTFEIKIAAYDNGQPPLYSDHVTTVLIHVTTLSEITPTFNRHLYSVSIPESLPVGTEIFDFEKNLKSLDASVQVKCRVEYDDNAVVATNNKLVTSVQFDMESQSFHTALLSCRNGLYDELSSTAILHINILDVNDNLPRVDKKPVEVLISESSVVGTVITNINVVDEDGNTTSIIFRILSGNMNDTFSISNIGQIVLKKSLDYEKVREFVLLVDISDRPNSLQRVTVVVNVQVLNENEFNPEFQMSRYETTISEQTKNASSIFQVLALDRDDFGLITYSIQPNNVFDIHPYTGVIQLHSEVDFERVKAYDLTLIAKDNSPEPRYGFSEFKVVLSDENDNNPICEQSRYIISVSESHPVGVTLLRIVAKDLDEGRNGLLMYMIEWKESDDNGFDITSDGQIVLTKALDYETKKQHKLKINVSDSGKPPKSLAVEVVINVVNVNEYSPKFTRQIFPIEISEATEPGTVLLQLSAFDLDDFGFIKYEINGSHMFRIDEYNGKISLVAPLDFEKQRFHEVVVSAKDNASKPLQSFAVVRLIVTDINDNPPIITSSNFQVILSELTSIGTPVYVLQAYDLDDGDSGALTFEISSQSKNGTFEISNTGCIILKNSLDFESISSHEIRITISDSTYPFYTANVSVIVNVLNENEFTPRFEQSQYSVAVLESTPKGSLLLQVSASDIDSFGYVTYDLSSTKPSNKTAFQIDQSGNVRLVSPLDFELTQEYVVVVSAKDNATSPLVGYSTIEIKVIDQNDNPPLPSFSKHVIHVSERTAIGSLLLSINHTDRDQLTRIQYSIESGNQDKTFEMNENGMLILLRELDFEKTQSFNLSIITADALVDPRHYARTNVTIHVLDENEHKPNFSKQVYEVNISESLPIHSEILHVHATDGDRFDSIEYEISDLSSQFFTINNKTGKIETSTVLDYENIRFYNFIVKAKDNSKIPRETTANVLVNILDENDNAPQFHQTIQYIKLVTPIAENESFHEISVHDRDSVFQSVSFSIFSQHDISDNSIDYFSIKKTSSDRAALVSKVKITENQNFTLKVQVSDVDGLTSNSTIHVDVQLRESDVRLPAALTDISKSTISLTLDLSKYFEDWKDRNHYVILAQEVHEKHEAFLTQTKLPPVTWDEVNKDGSENFMRRYYAIDYDYVTKVGRRRRSVTDFSVQTGRMSFVIGSENTCDGKVTCNGKLKPDRIYRFQLIASGPNRPAVYSQFTQTFATSITSQQYTADTSNHYLFVLSLSLSIVGFLFLISLMVIAWLLYKQRGSKYQLKEEKDDSSHNAFELTPRQSFPGNRHIPGGLFSGINVRKDHEIHAIQVNRNEKTKSNPVFSGSADDSFPKLSLLFANKNLDEDSQQEDILVKGNRMPYENDDESLSAIAIDPPQEHDGEGHGVNDPTLINNDDTMEQHDQSNDSLQVDDMDVDQSTYHKTSSSSDSDTFNYKKLRDGSVVTDLTDVSYFDVTSIKPSTSDSKSILLENADDQKQHLMFEEESEKVIVTDVDMDDGAESDTSLGNIRRLSVVQRQIKEIESHAILEDELSRTKDSDNGYDKEKYRAIIDHWRKRSRAGQSQSSNKPEQHRISYVQF